MKNISIKYPVLVALIPVLLFSCKKFADVNTNPVSANNNQVQPEYFINNAITQAQMNPDPSERAFVLYWAAAGHQISDADGSTFSWGSYNDGWTTDYYNNQASALGYVNSAITVGNQQIAAGTQKLYTSNLIWIARIWRAYMISELSDGFGPMPINGFQGVNPDFSDVKSVYYYLLSELDSASAGINVNVSAASTTLAAEDPAYGYNWLLWQQYANSMRLRLAMRLSQVDPNKAQAEYVAAAATNNFITSNSAAFGVKEAKGYNSLSGMYSRPWYLAPIAVTLNNLIVNLGGVTSASQLPNVISDPTQLSAAQANVKPANYVGQNLPVQLTTMTNNPYSVYYFDGMPATIDPRAYQIFYIPGNSSSTTFPSSAVYGVDNITTGTFLNADGKTAFKTFNAAYTWNPVMDGNWGTKGGQTNALDSMQNIDIANGMVPCLQSKFRTQTTTRIFFGPWETYFLLAEGAVRGWTTPISAQSAYDSGISTSFQYWGVSNYLPAYLASDDYNRVGTSVDWNHTAEPAASFTAAYVDGVTGTPGTTPIYYPTNNLYQGGSVKNDHLTKIITQKFIAQTPWLPLETWNDHRRLGLPFFENVVLEQPINTLPTLSSANLNTCNVQFLPQRIIYPSSLKNSNVNGYNEAVSALGGADAVLTPLWWAQH